MAMQLDASGNVGIGTTAPDNSLTIKGTTLGGAGGKVSIYGGGDENSVSAARNEVLRLGRADTAGSYYNSIWSATGSGSDSSHWLRFYIGKADGSSQTMAMQLDASGNVGIGTTEPNQKLTIEGTMSLKEQANANADVAAYGQVWVKTATPNELYFTDDAGTDTQISSHPIDAPSALYINGPGLDWVGKRIQKYLGVIFWQKIDGTITEETFGLQSST